MNEQPTNPPGLDVDGLRRGRSGAIVRARTHFVHADEAGQAALLDALVAAARDSAACLDLLLELLRVHRVLHPPLRRYLFSDDDIDAVAAQANDSVFGLAASIWTRDLSAAHKLAKKVKAGSVWINQHHFFDPALPFGGFKQSGYGREEGSEAIRTFTEVKSVAIAL